MYNNHVYLYRLRQWNILYSYPRGQKKLDVQRSTFAERYEKFATEHFIRVSTWVFFHRFQSAQVLVQVKHKKGTGKIRVGEGMVRGSNFSRSKGVGERLERGNCVH